MTNEEKQSLIEDCKREIAHFKRCIEVYPDAPVIRSDLMRQEIALSALTAQPVKLPNKEHIFPGCDTQQMTILLTHNAAIDGCAEAIRAAGYQVESE